MKKLLSILSISLIIFSLSACKTSDSDAVDSLPTASIIPKKQYITHDETQVYEWKCDIAPAKIKVYSGSPLEGFFITEDDTLYEYNSETIFPETEKCYRKIDTDLKFIYIYYHFQLDRLSVLTDDFKTYTYNKTLPGRTTIVNASEFYQSFKKDTVKVTSTMVDGTVFGIDGQMAKLEIGTMQDDYQMIILKENPVFEKLNDSVNKVVFAIYNDAEEDIAVTLDVKHAKQKLYISMPETLLTSKEITYIEIPLLSVDWKKSGEIEHIRFTFGDGEGQEAKTIYVKDAIIFDK